MMRIIKRKLHNNGFDGVLFTSERPSGKAMIVITGSDGGLKYACRTAEFYFRNGTDALAVALFGTKYTGKHLDKVPVEYIENAFAYLQKSGYTKIGIDGLSKGSELAIYSAIKFKEISCVVLRVPSYYASEGLIKKQPSGHSCWSENGNELEYTPYATRRFTIVQRFICAKEFNLLPYNRNKDVNPNSIFDVAKINVPILLFSSKVDTVWDSYEQALYLEKTIKSCKRDTVKHIAFENIGHMMFNRIGCFTKMMFRSERENKKLCAQERETLAKEILQWLKNAF